MKIHMAENLHKCRYCPKQYKVERCAIAHMKKNHLTEWAADQKKTTANLEKDNELKLN